MLLSIVLNAPKVVYSIKTNVLVNAFQVCIKILMEYVKIAHRTVKSVLIPMKIALNATAH